MLLISDLHFGTLLPTSVEGFILNAALSDVDKLVLISGDITTNSKKEEFERAEKFFVLLLQNGITIAATPGNHDFGGWSAELLHRVTADYARARAELDQIFQPLYKQPNVIAYNSEFFDMIVQHGNDVFCCLKSQHRSAPRIKQRQIRWANAVIEKLKEQPVRLFFMCHHSLWQDASDHHAPMIKLERVENFLAQHKFYAFIHGHNHRFTYQNTTTPNKGYRVYRVAAPTACTKNREWEQGIVTWRPPNEALLQTLPSDLYIPNQDEVDKKGKKGKQPLIV